MPYVTDGPTLRNLYFVHVVNKTPDASDFEISLDVPQGASALIPVPVMHLESMDDRRIPVVVQMPSKEYAGAPMVVAHTRNKADGVSVTSQLRFLGPD
jgi:hypothetical protein